MVFRNYIIHGKSCRSQMVVGHKVVPSSSTRHIMRLIISHYMLSFKSIPTCNKLKLYKQYYSCQCFFYGLASVTVPCKPNTMGELLVYSSPYRLRLDSYTKSPEMTQKNVTWWMNPPSPQRKRTSIYHKIIIFSMYVYVISTGNGSLVCSGNRSP